MLDFFRSFDRRIIFIFIFIATAIPLVAYIGLPISITPPVQDLYNYIERLPEGSKILVSCDYDPGSMPELLPMNVAIFKHLFERNMKVYSICLWPAAPPLVEQSWQETGAAMGKEYGVDFVSLGYKSGNQVVMVKMGTSIPETFPEDYRGTPLSEIPMMTDIVNYSNLDFIINISAGFPGTREWVQQVVSRYNINLGSGCTAVSAPEFYSYYQSKQIIGLLGGLKAAAEYETLVNIPTETIKARAIPGMDAQSLVHIVIVLFIIMGNIIYFFERKSDQNAKLQKNQ